MDDLSANNFTVAALASYARGVRSNSFALQIFFSFSGGKYGIKITVDKKTNNNNNPKWIEKMQVISRVKVVFCVHGFLIRIL